jgi:hypothetical protein
MAVERIMTILTPQQQAKWRELAGPPYNGPQPHVFGLQNKK